LLIHLTSLEGIITEKKLEELKKDVTYKIMNEQNRLGNLDLRPEHIRPERMHFSVMVRVFPNELQSQQQFIDVKQRKPRATREEISRRVFKDFGRFRL